MNLVVTPFILFRFRSRVGERSRVWMTKTMRLPQRGQTPYGRDSAVTSKDGAGLIEVYFGDILES